MSEINALTAVAMTCFGLAFLLVIWSDLWEQVHFEADVPERYAQVLDAVLTALIVFALCDIWGVF